MTEQAKIGRKWIWDYGKQLVGKIKDDDLAGLSAELTYYLVLSFFPFLLFLINLLSFTRLGDQALVMDFNQYLPGDMADLISQVISETVQSRSGLVLVTAILGTLWISAKGMRAIIKGLNKIHDLQERRSFIRLYLVSLGFVVALAMLILLSIVFLVFGEIIGKTLFGWLGISWLFGTLWLVMRYGLSTLMMFAVFCLLYRFGPNTDVRWRQVPLGAGFAVVGWVLIAYGFSVYVNHFANYQRVYGSLGAVIVLLLWLYLNSMVILIGEELNQLTAQWHRDRGKN